MARRYPLRRRAFGTASFPSLLATGTASRSGSGLHTGEPGAKARARGSVGAWACSPFFSSPPPPRLRARGDVADDCLAPGVDVNMLDADGLLAAAAKFRECFN